MSIAICIVYSRQDEKLREQLETYLAPFKQLDLFSSWQDCTIGEDQGWQHELEDCLSGAQMVLLLVSESFIASDYCYSVELEQLAAQHQSGARCVIPIILQPVAWQKTPLGQFRVLPRDGQAVTDWADQDQAFFSITRGVKAAVRRLNLEYENRLRLQLYGQDFYTAIQRKYPLSPSALNKLKQAQEALKLGGESVALAEQRILLQTLYSQLRDLLTCAQWQAADQETVTLLLRLARRTSEGYLTPDSIRQLPCRDLQLIDQLWVEHSHGRFGFRVQKRIWQSLGGQLNSEYLTYSQFGERVGWRNREQWLRTEDEISFSLDAPIGHLPAKIYFSGFWIGFVIWPSLFARRDW